MMLFQSMLYISKYVKKIGKSMAWHVLLKALERLEGVKGVAHVIDPKV